MEDGSGASKPTRRWRSATMLWNLVRALPALYKLSRQRPHPIFEQRIPKAPAVVRRDHLVSLAKGKRVLHFGFLDHPFSREKLERGELLHSRLRASAAFLYGLDIDEPSLALYREVTGDNQNAILDVDSDGAALDLAMGFDLILFPEILEHLRNPGQALERLQKIALSNPGSEVCVTVPNAMSLKWIGPALGGVELVHPGHFAYFSPHTLRNLLESSGFGDVRISFCWEGTTLGRIVPGLAHEGVIALCRAA